MKALVHHRLMTTDDEAGEASAVVALLVLLPHLQAAQVTAPHLHERHAGDSPCL